MKKSTLISLFCVEIARLYILLASNSGLAYKDLTLAWFFALPLLSVPLVLLFVCFLSEEYAPYCLKAYAFTRIFYVVSALAYMTVNYLLAYKSKIAQINYLPAVILSIFLVFDVIIMIYIYLRDKKCR